MPSIQVLATRGDHPAKDGELSPLMVKLLITLLVLVLLGIASVGLLFLLKHMRRAQKMRNASQLPMYHPNAPQEGLSARRGSHHRQTSISSTPSGFGQEKAAHRPSSLYFYSEKQALCSSPGSTPPASPIPEIRITFPEEVDESGKRQSGRVVVVRVGDTTVGMEPYEDLPPYERREGEGAFHSLDLDRMGGLKEKEDLYMDEKRWS